MSIPDIMELPPRRRLLLLPPVLIATGFLYWQRQLEYAWLELAFGQFGRLFWALVAAWGVSTIIAIWRTRCWWLLLSGLAFLYPVGVAIALIVACTQGNCI